LRLLYFDLTQGNRIGGQFIINELGWLKGTQILFRLKWKQTYDNPFNEINLQAVPTSKQRLSQRQMAPLVILYRLLLSDGFPTEQALDICGRLSKKVAVAFLDFSIPQIRKVDWSGESAERKTQMLNKITERFFNAESETELKPNDEFVINVQACHFASYAMQLGVPELGPLFCESDKYYFDHFQKEVNFGRTQTLAIEGRPCDFRFNWK